MTLLQLKYIVTVAAAGTISEAAKQLYIAQPSLTSAIKELENELGITIFKRTNKGILLSAEGEEFLGYARQVIEQTNLIEERYLGKTPVFTGAESDMAFLNNASRCMERFGYPSVGLNELIRWQAEWLLSGGRILNKPTHFEERAGKF